MSLRSGNAFGRSFFILGIAVALSSCASLSGPALQPRVNGLIMSGDVGLAAEKITAEQADYGSGNYLLYHLDRGLVLQMAGDLSGSIQSLEKAKARYEELYTRSITNEASTWVVNDNMAPYRSPAYERVLMNVFQAFNYLQMNDLAEALVEARDLDSKFPVITGVPAAQRERFEDNGFARLVCGILYDAAGSPDDALIDYKRALALYDAYYGGQYVPRVLQQGLLRLSARLHDEDLDAYRSRFADVRAEASGLARATVYFFESVGFAPVKVSDMIPVPVDRGLIIKIAFPRFMRRSYEAGPSRAVATGASGRRWHAEAELGADIEDLAEKDLESRKALTLAKAIARPALKYAVERNQKEIIEKRSGPLAAGVFGLFSNVYNFLTEQADLRSWQSLPAQIRVARMELPPGSYALSMERSGARDNRAPEGEGSVTVDLQDGQTYFFIRRSWR